MNCNLIYVLYSFSQEGTSPPLQIQDFFQHIIQEVFLLYHTESIYIPFLVFSVFLHSVEKMPSVQSLVAASSFPNIWGAVIALGFIRISLCGWPHCVSALISMVMTIVFPDPLGPSVISPWRTRDVSYN